MFNNSEIRELIAERLGREAVPKSINIITDTTDFFRVAYDDVLLLGGRPYLVRHDQKEGRFGIDEQPKFWVKKAIDLTDGSLKIIKLTFLERFTSKVGDLCFECFRSPRKEARILEIVRGDLRFMQGFSVSDSAGNIVRILDFIKGKSFADYILTFKVNHEEYFYNIFPHILDEFIDLVKAIALLHSHNEKHGDIRRDHIIKESGSDISRWIDFDYNYIHRENMFGYDIFGLGNILSYIAGKGDITIQDIKSQHPEVFYELSEEDMNIIFNSRIVNIKKLFPYIPEALNTALLHFSVGAQVFYDHTSQFLNDIEEIRTII